MSFLTAEWRKLILVNYVVDPEVLAPFVPHGTSIDFFDEKCFVSLVGFMFVNTRLLGFKIPFHVNFEEVNLRFYVRPMNDTSKRGVVFIKEIVPRYALTFVANTFYREHYQTLPMRHHWAIERKKQQIQYAWKIQDSWQQMIIDADKQAIPIDPESETAFITEHYWGYTKVNDHRTFEYQVTHPTWDHYPVLDSQVQVDFGLTYGNHFAFLNQLDPASIMLAEGSKITVENKKLIR